MLRPLLRCSPASARTRLALNSHVYRLPLTPSRSIFGLFRRSPKQEKPKDPVPLLTEDNLFHPFSNSPFPAIQARGEAIKKLAPCPVCAPGGHAHSEPSATVKAVAFECPDCGWPTHCSEEHWKEDTEHQKYCTKLREANEDEHDLRSGRRLREFELPGVCRFSTELPRFRT